MTDSVQASLDALRDAIGRLPDVGLAGTEIGPGGRDPAELRWSALDAHADLRLAGRRVLAVGPGAGDDAVAFARRGAQYALACEPPDTPIATGRGQSVDRSVVEFREAEWEELDSSRDGTFDLVHCNALLHRVLEPMTLLRNLRRVISPGGSLLICSMMLADPERSEFLRFVPDRYAGDPTWWFVPGRLAFRWLVETAGFAVELEFGELEGPRDGLPMISGYLRARAD